MNQELVVKNYYRASGAIMEIALSEDLPEELKRICIEASSKIIRIIDYVNKQNLEAFEEKEISQKASKATSACHLCSGLGMIIADGKTCTRCGGTGNISHIIHNTRRRD